MPERATAFRFRFSCAPPSAYAAPTFRHSCGSSSPADGSASRRGLVARRFTKSSPFSGPGWSQLGGDWRLMGFGLPQYLGLLIFWLMNLYFVWNGTESHQVAGDDFGAAPHRGGPGTALVGARSRAGGFAHVRGATALGGAPHRRFALFLPWVTAMVGFWATLALNIPDFTRFARSQRDQIGWSGVRAPDHHAALCLHRRSPSPAPRCAFTAKRSGTL